MQGLKEVSDKKIRENNRPEGNWKGFNFQGETEKEFGRNPAQVNPQPALHIEGLVTLFCSCVPDWDGTFWKSWHVHDCNISTANCIPSVFSIVVIKRNQQKNISNAFLGSQFLVAWPECVWRLSCVSGYFIKSATSFVISGILTLVLSKCCKALFNVTFKS